MKVWQCLTVENDQCEVAIKSTKVKAKQWLSNHLAKKEGQDILDEVSWTVHDDGRIWLDSFGWIREFEVDSPIDSSF